MSTLQSRTPRTGTPSSPFPESVFQRSEQPCEDQRPQQSGALTELPPLTGYEPNRIAEDRDYRHLDDEQLRALLASPLHQQERGASSERSQV